MDHGARGRGGALGLIPLGIVCLPFSLWSGHEFDFPIMLGAGCLFLTFHLM